MSSIASEADIEKMLFAVMKKNISLHIANIPYSPKVYCLGALTW